MENDLYEITPFLLTVLLVLVKGTHHDLVFERQRLLFSAILSFTLYYVTIRHKNHLIVILIIALINKVSFSDLQISCLIS
jgi:hypothetical protein